MHLFHKWSKWERYVWTGKIGGFVWQPNAPMRDATEERQKRTCSVCGKTQDENII